MSDNGGGFFVGFVLGALAGAAAALLLAPASGEEIRKQLGDKSVELKEQAQKLADDTKTKAQQQASYVQEQGRIVLAENVKKVQQVVQDAQAKLGEAGETA